MNSPPISMTQPIQLVNLQDNRVIVKFPEGLKGKPQFQEESKFLEKSMKDLGIFIPQDLKSTYPELGTGEKRKIYLSDISFGKAFYEVYFPKMKPQDQFAWQKL